MLPTEIWYSLPSPESGDDIVETVIWAEIESDVARYPVLSFKTSNEFVKRFKALAEDRIVTYVFALRMFIS